MSWCVAGGLAGALVAIGHMYAGSLSSSVGFLTATLFFAVGSVIGFAHGGLLGYLGRPLGETRSAALRRAVLGAGYSVPVLFGGWVVAMVLAVSATAYLSGRYLTFAATLAGWVMAAGLLGWAWVEGRRTWVCLRDRWPGVRAVAFAVGLAAGALLPVFLIARPEIWVLGMEPTSTAAVAMALAASVWIVGPSATLVLLATRGLRGPTASATGVRDA